MVKSKAESDLDMIKEKLGRDEKVTTLGNWRVERAET
jgi:hypothetical protein